MTRLLALVGPTAAGKTRMAVEVATRLSRRVEIVSCDSMAVYRELDIVADKPSETERDGIPHHLFDAVGAGEEFTVVEYRERARAQIERIHADGGVPMLVGGSGLYFRGVVDDLEFGPTSPEARERLEREDPRVLLETLRRADPQGAARLDPRNVRRVVRAAEVLELSGRTPSQTAQAWSRRESRYALTVAGLTWARSDLYRRVEERVDRQLASGILEEVAGVLDGLSRSSAQALGVRELGAVVRGEWSHEHARYELVRNTKAFARRQLSWFRADPRVEWVDASQLGWEGARDRLVELFSAQG